MWKMIYRTSFVKLFICVIFIYFLVDNDKIVEVKKEIKEEPLDEDVINVETFDDDPMIIDKPQVQEMFDVQKRKAEGLYLFSITRVLSDHENSDVRSDQDHYVEKWSKIRSDRILEKWTDLIWFDLKFSDHYQIILRKIIMEKIRNFYIFWEKKIPTILHVFRSALILGS